MMDFLDFAGSELTFLLERLFLRSGERFADPLWLLLLLLIPAWFFWYFKKYLPNKLIIPSSYDPDRLMKRKISPGFIRWFAPGLQLLGIMYIIIGIARPQSVLETRIRSAEGIDIMLLLDTSHSMEANDFQPTRLEVAKETAMNFIDGRTGDRIGMVLFAEDAFSYAPLTLDYALLKELISEISPKTLPNEGTALGTAIGIGINRLESSQGKSKIMILLTDGASNRGQLSPLTAASVAAEKDIRIYSIGIGKVHKQGNNSSDLDVEALKQIASVTGGKFYRTANKANLEDVFTEISQMEQTAVHEEMLRDVTDVYPRYLFFGFASFMLAYILISLLISNPLEE